MAAGVECFRVLFPKGMDANDVARKMHPAEKTLGLFAIVGPDDQPLAAAGEPAAFEMCRPTAG